MKLDPVAVDRAGGSAGDGACRIGERASCRGLGRPGCAQHSLEPECAVDRPRIDARPSPGQQRCLHAGGGGQSNLDRLAIRSECATSAAGAQQCDSDRVVALSRRQVEQRCGGDRGADRTADGGWVPARVVQRWMTGRGDRGHRFVACRIGLKRRPERALQVGRQNQRRRRGGRAHVRDAVGKGVIEVEHMAGGAGKGNVAEQIVARGSHGTRSARVHTGARTGQPIGERHQISGVGVRVVRLDRAGAVARWGGVGRHPGKPSAAFRGEDLRRPHEPRRGGCRVRRHPPATPSHSPDSSANSCSGPTVSWRCPTTG
jgi:hypothetical protein